MLVTIGSTHFITHGFYYGDNKYTKFAVVGVAVRRVKINDSFSVRCIAAGTKQDGGLPNYNKNTETGCRTKTDNQISYVTFTLD